MIGKKLIYDSPLIEREDSTVISANGVVSVILDYVVGDYDYWLIGEGGSFNKVQKNTNYNINASSELEILKDRNKITALALSSTDTLNFDSSLLNRFPALKGFRVESDDSILRINNIPYSCQRISFAGGELKDGYSTRKFSNVIDYFDLRNGKGVGLSTSEVDQLLIDLETYSFVGVKLIRILGVNEPRSSVSASAVTSLESRGVTVRTYVTNNINNYSLFFGSNSTDACRGITGGTFYQYSDSFNFSKPFYTDAGATTLAPANWYSDGLSNREWSGAVWLGSVSTCTL